MAPTLAHRGSSFDVQYRFKGACKISLPKAQRTRGDSAVSRKGSILVLEETIEIVRQFLCRVQIVPPVSIRRRFVLAEESTKTRFNGGGKKGTSGKELSRHLDLYHPCFENLSFMILLSCLCTSSCSLCLPSRCGPFEDTSRKHLPIENYIYNLSS